MGKGRLLCGDNLELLRRKIEDESVDLVYLDPPFQSGRDYSVVFEARSHKPPRKRARTEAFKDTWQWDERAEASYADAVRLADPADRVGAGVVTVLRALRTILGATDIMAYLAGMAPRL